MPAWRDRLLTTGVEWSDRASAVLFREAHPAPTFAEADLTPFDQFPYNGFGPPEIDVAQWTLAVGGAVATPGAYDLAAVRALPKQVQNTRHVCVEGWGDYFLFGPKPPATAQYNGLQKFAYTGALAFGTLSMLTGLVMYKPVQFSALGRMCGGYDGARLVHFLAMCGLLSFIPGHLVMVALHGWDNFASMVTGWKHKPDYVLQEPRR